MIKSFAKVEVKLLDSTLPDRMDPEQEILPDYATLGAAGLDLRSSEGLILKPGQSHKFHTGIAIYIGDMNICGLLVPRSSLGIKKIHLTNTLGIIDSDYQGELLIPLTNNGDEPYHVEFGQRIAQMVMLPVIQVQWEAVLDFSAPTQRCEGGFGSTGKT
tara:strand:+ start:1137 stop:1613 length:477 start_codon:yes stop_codon:yes gene_type:complete